MKTFALTSQYTNNVDLRLSWRDGVITRDLVPPSATAMVDEMVERDVIRYVDENDGDGQRQRVTPITSPAFFDELAMNHVNQFRGLAEVVDRSGFSKEVFYANGEPAPASMRTASSTAYVYKRRFQIQLSGSGYPDIAYFYFGDRPAPGSVARTDEGGDESWIVGLLVDYDAAKKPVGIEILSPRRTSLARMNRLLAHLGLEQLAESEWPASFGTDVLPPCACETPHFEKLAASEVCTICRGDRP